MDWICFVWQQKCDISGMAAWVQAILSAAAIWWAARSATKQAEAQHKTAMQQVKKQHELDLDIRKNEIASRKRNIAKTLAERLRHADGVLHAIKRDVDIASLEPTSFTPHQKTTYQDMLEDLISDMSSISIFELEDVALVNDHAVLRSTFKQTLFNYKLLLDIQTPYNQDLKDALFPIIKSAKEEVVRYRDKLIKYANEV